jgi:hypothetical protein
MVNVVSEKGQVSVPVSNDDNGHALMWKKKKSILWIYLIEKS